MKRWLAALVLLAVLATLYSCEDEMLASVTSETVAGVSLAVQTAEPEAEDGTAAGAPVETEREEVIVYEDRILVVLHADESVYKTFSDAVNAIFRWFPEGTRKFLMIAPNRISFEVDELRSLASDQKKEIRDVYMAMDPSITLLDAYYALSLYAGNLNDIFFRTENHWTHLGSYYAAQVFFEAAEIPFHTLDEYVRSEGEPFLGYLQDIVNDPFFYDKPDSLVYYLLPGVDRTGSIFYKSVETGELEETQIREVDLDRRGYGIFLGENGFSHAIISGDPASDRSLLLIGDSYSNAIVTWFADSYKTVILVDPRYFEGGVDALGAFMKDYAITDALVLVSSSKGFSGVIKKLFGFAW